MNKDNKLPLEQRLLLNLNLTSESTKGSALSPTSEIQGNNEEIVVNQIGDEEEEVKEKGVLTKAESISSKNFKSLTEQVSLSYLENGNDNMSYPVVKHLESLIGEIKTNTIERIKAELEEINKQKYILENSVNTIKSNLKFVKSHKKICGGKNVKLLNENDILFSRGEVSLPSLIVRELIEKLTFTKKRCLT